MTQMIVHDQCNTLSPGKATSNMLKRVSSTLFQPLMTLLEKHSRNMESKYQFRKSMLIYPRSLGLNYIIEVYKQMTVSRFCEGSYSCQITMKFGLHPQIRLLDVMKSKAAISLTLYLRCKVIAAPGLYSVILQSYWRTQANICGRKLYHHHDHACKSLVFFPTQRRFCEVSCLQLQKKVTT